MTNEQIKFLTQIAPLAKSEQNKRQKWVLPSVCIAQAAIETGFGKSSLMVKANAYFGIKAGSAWKGKVYSAKTKECYDGVNMTAITDLFRAYGSPAESVKDYYDLITGNARYAGAVNQPDPLKAITAIKNGGYATDPDYVNKVMSIIKENNLTDYDGSGGSPSVRSACPYAYPAITVTSAVNAAKRGCSKYLSTGDAAKWVQWHLARLGYDLGPKGIDGNCGSKTVEAIEAYQRAAGLVVDGLAGPKTVAKLDAM